MIPNSSTLEKMLSSKKGFRTENYSGSGVRDLKEILKFEIGQLGNTDILAYMRSNYNCLQDFKIDDYVIEALKEEAESEGGLQLLIFEEERNLAIENYDYLIEEILEFINNRFREEVMGLWLTSYDAVVKRYGGKTGDIDCYEIPDESIVISDLGIDGALFVFPKRLLNIKTLFLQS